MSGEGFLNYDPNYVDTQPRLTEKAGHKFGCIFLVFFLALFAAGFFYLLSDHDGGKVSLTLLLPAAAQARLDGEPIAGKAVSAAAGTSLQILRLQVTPGKHALAIVDNGKAHGFPIEIPAQSTSNVYQYKDGQLTRTGM